MSQPKLYYTKDNTTGWSNNYTQFDVLERVLCDGWGNLEVVKAEAKDNYLHLEFAEDVPKTMQWWSLVELTTRVAAIDGHYRCVGVNGKTASFKPIDRIVPNYTGSATGTLDHVSAGWTKLFKDESTLVVRPKTEPNRCFLVRQNLHQHGYIANLNEPWKLLPLPNNTNAQFANNAFVQIAQLSGWDNTLSLADNYTRYVVPIKQNIPGVETLNHTMVPSVTNIISTNPWYIVATDSYCYFGSKYATDWHPNITGFGIGTDVFGMSRSFFIGFSWWTVTTSVSYSVNRMCYGVANVSSTTTSTSSIESPDGKTVLRGLNTITAQFGNDLSTNEYRFKYIVPKCDPVNVSLGLSMSVYFTLPGSYWYNGNLQTSIEVNTVDNKEMLCIAVSSSDNNPSNCSYVGVEL